MEYKVPLFDLNFDEREEEAVIETIKSKWISTGPKCSEFEERFADALTAKYALATSNCTVALHLALEVLGIKDGDEVIVPSMTFAATVNSVKYTGANPVFADIVSSEDLTISPDDIQRKVTSKTKAIIVMHFAGFPCDMKAIVELSERYGLFLIEDSCHAPLSEYCGKKLGTFGHFACYSFFSNKNMSTGEGGMLVTNNQNYYEKAKLLRSHGMTTMSYQRASGHATSYDITSVGYNYRMDDIRASIGIIQLEKLNIDLQQRMKVRSWYLEYLSDCDIIIPFKDNTEFVSNYIMPIVLKKSSKKKRDKVRRELLQRGIQTSNHYPAVHLFSCYSNERSYSLPVTEYVADNEVTLPMYSSMSESDVKKICSELQDVLNVMYHD